jgi:hypothetical protein
VHVEVSWLRLSEPAAPRTVVEHVGLLDGLVGVQGDRVNRHVVLVPDLRALAEGKRIGRSSWSAADCGRSPSAASLTASSTSPRRDA